jgi:hypothetical protein
MMTRPLIPGQRQPDIVAQRTELREELIAEYLRISGPRLANTVAARRIGVDTRTISRYRAILRERGQLPGYLPPAERPGCMLPGWCGCGCGRRTTIRRNNRGGPVGEPYACVRGHQKAAAGKAAAA